MAKFHGQRLAAVIRAGVIGIAGFALYAVIPVPTREEPAVGALFFIVALAAVASVIGWAVQRSWSTTEVRLRLRMLVLTVYLVALVFALTYLALSTTQPAAFSAPMNRVDALYFAMTVLSTVGFGDITAVSTTARVVVTIQMAFNLVVVTTAISLIAASSPRHTDR